MENNNENDVVENKNVEVKHCDKEFRHNHCGNNNILAIIAIILSVIAIGLSAYTLGVCSNKNTRDKNNGKRHIAQEQMATTSYTKRCPMCNQFFDGKFNNGMRNFGNRKNYRNSNNQPRWDNSNFRGNNWENYFGNGFGRQFDGYDWESFNPDYMNGWRNHSFNNNSDSNNKSDNNITENKESTNNNKNGFNRNFNNDGWNNWWGNNSRNNRRHNNNQNNNIEPGSLPKINGNDQAPNKKDEDIKRPLPVPPKVEER